MSNSSKNATKHGCCAAGTLILPTENEQDFNNLEALYVKAYTPRDEHERHLVQDIVLADWMLQRATRAHAQVESALYEASPNPADWTELQERKLGRHIRYRTAQTNILAKCRKALEDHRKARLAEKTAAEKSALTQERIKVAQKKASPIVDWQQKLRNMRAEAVARGFVSPDEPNPFDKAPYTK
jgi:hypothetical protein